MGALTVVVLLKGLLLVSAQLCLFDGTPESRRQYIQETVDGEGVQASPLRMVVLNWISAEVCTELMAILLAEVLGYQVAINSEKVVSSTAAALQLAGCVSRDCSERQRRSHVAMDVWLAGRSGELADFSQTSPNSPIRNLGSMGWTGQETLYVKGSLRDDAYYISGLALDFYRSYNTSLHHECF